MQIYPRRWPRRSQPRLASCPLARHQLRRLMAPDLVTPQRLMLSIGRALPDLWQARQKLP